MEIKITAAQMLKMLYILSWILFIGICIEAGGFIFNAFYTLVVNPAGASKFWMEIDFSGLYEFDRGHFFAETTLMCIVAVMRALIFYLVVKILHDKKLDLFKPFNKEVVESISRVSYLAIGIGFFSYWAVNYAAWLTSLGVTMPDAQSMRIAGADVWLFMGITLLVIAQIFKRGIELQTENELTI
jgi:hypothetical protein